jgi:hypothetical protein
MIEIGHCQAQYVRSRYRDSLRLEGAVTLAKKHGDLSAGCAWGVIRAGDHEIEIAIAIYVGSGDSDYPVRDRDLVGNRLRKATVSVAKHHRRRTTLEYRARISALLKDEIGIAIVIEVGDQ